MRLTIPRGEEIAFVVIPFAALQIVAIGLKSDDEASMRAAFLGQAFALNAKLSHRVSLLGSGEILLVTPAMLRSRDRTSKRKARLEDKGPGAA